MMNGNAEFGLEEFAEDELLDPEIEADDDDFEYSELYDTPTAGEFDDDEEGFAGETFLGERRGRRIKTLERQVRTLLKARPGASAGIRNNRRAIAKVNRRVTTTWRRATGNLRRNKLQQRDIRKMRGDLENFRTMSMLTMLMQPDTEEFTLVDGAGPIPAKTTMKLKREPSDEMMKLLPFLLGTGGGSGGNNMMLLALALSDSK